ncbi:MAG: hypothetical protein HYT93_05070 [Parcubacteria group bacterium]|nr:hypothetical protein [Parcubacteria group bacterium]
MAKKSKKTRFIEFNLPFESPNQSVEFKFNLAIKVAPKHKHDIIHFTVMAGNTSKYDSMLVIKRSFSQIKDIKHFLMSVEFTGLFTRIFKENCSDAITQFLKTVDTRSLKKKIEEIRTAHPHCKKSR